MQNLIIIPARGGSKTISRQNLRFVNNKPLLYYVLKTAISSKIADVFVSTESVEIQEFALDMGVGVIKRPKQLSRNLVSFEEITNHAINYLKKDGKIYEKCVVISPGIPLVTVKTIKKFFSNLQTPTKNIIGFVESKNDTRKISLDNVLPKLNKVPGNIIHTKKIMGFYCNDFQSRNLKNPFYGIKLNQIESTTIHNYHDLETVNQILKQRRILVRVDGSERIGLGHVYNMLTLLNYFQNDEILVVMNSKKILGENKFKMHGYKLQKFTTKKQLEKIIDNFKPDIFINDILDTKKDYIINLKKKYFVINFEDLGKGSHHAHLVFNPIYQSKIKNSKKFFGSEYACVRDEFRILKSKIPKKNITKILITFGGTDPYNITTKILGFIKKLPLQKYEIIVILGLGNSHKNKINVIQSKMTKINYQIKIINDSNLMAKHIRDSDFVISGNGRTVFEIASLNVPMITISANKREESHQFSSLTGGAIHLGTYSRINFNMFEKSIYKMLHYKNRLQYSKNLKKHDILNGVNKITFKINSEYEKIPNI